MVKICFYDILSSCKLDYTDNAKSEYVWNHFVSVIEDLEHDVEEKHVENLIIADNEEY